jgi:hypothetical protein
MERITMLHQQASVLRMLAGSFDIHTTIRDQLLAARCEDLASALEKAPQAGDVRPDDSV